MEKLPKVGYHRKVSAEGIISLEPTLVIGSAASGPAESLDKLEKVGIQLRRVNSEKTLEGAQTRITEIAKMLGRSKQGKELVDKMNAELKQVKKPEKGFKCQPEAHFGMLTYKYKSLIFTDQKNLMCFKNRSHPLGKRRRW